MLRSLLSCYIPPEPEFTAARAPLAPAASKMATGAAPVAGGGACSLGQRLKLIANRPLMKKRMVSAPAPGSLPATPGLDAFPVRAGLDTLPEALIRHIGDYLGAGDLLRLSSTCKTLNQGLKMQRNSVLLADSLTRQCGYKRVVMLVGQDGMPGILATYPPSGQLAPVLRIIERAEPADSAGAEFIFHRLSLFISAWPAALQNQGWPALSRYRLKGMSAAALAAACRHLLRPPPALSMACRDHIAINVLYHFRLLAPPDRGGILLRLLELVSHGGDAAREDVINGLALDVFHLFPLHILPALDLLLAAALTLPANGRLRVFRELRCQLPHINLYGLNHEVTNRLVSAWQRAMN